MESFKHQEQFISEMVESWINGNRNHVRTVLRNLESQNQAMYLSASIALALGDKGQSFVNFINPNN